MEAVMDAGAASARRGKKPRAQKLEEQAKASRRRATRAAEQRTHERKKHKAGVSGEAHPEVNNGNAEAHPAGMSTEYVLADDKSLNQVKTRGFSMRGLQAHLVEGAARFARDWESAFGALRCRGFEPGVDGAKSHQAHLTRLDATERIENLRARLGEDGYKLLVATVIANVGPDELNKLGGPKSTVFTHEIKKILREVCQFYSGRRLAIDPMRKAVDRVIQRIIDAGDTPETREILASIT